MTDREFLRLKLDLTHKIREVEKLQAIYRKETGRTFVPNVHIKIDERKK